MAERVRQGPLDAACPAALARLAGLAVLVLLAATACSSDYTKTDVRGEVLTKKDPYLGGPSPVESEFRAGERAVYGSGIVPSLNPGSPSRSRLDPPTASN